MENRITNISIENFKSLKKLEVTNCKRINLFIGKPNVGKSNLLEALSLFEEKYTVDNKMFLNEFIRYKKPKELFYDYNTTEDITVNTNLGGVRFHYSFNKDRFRLSWQNDDLFFGVNVSNDGVMLDHTSLKDPLKIKKYEFRGSKEIDFQYPNNLLPPHGKNLFSILYSNQELRKEIQDIFNEYDQKIALKPHERSIEIFKEMDGGFYAYNYDSTADTIQRFIFHLAAIESNTNSILLFEEPEAHSFPDYIKRLARKIQESETNQFFITTHSPFIINTLLEGDTKDELAIYVMNYENHQTTIHQLTKEEIEDMVSDGGELILSSKIV